MPHPEELSTLMQTMLDCVESSLTDPVGLSFVAPGDSVAWDDCCSGQLWTRIVSLVGAPSRSNGALMNCSQMYQLRWEVGILRCAAHVSETGDFPSGGKMQDDAFTTYRDWYDITKGLVCCFREKTDTFRIEDWAPQGPDGACVGGVVTGTLNIIPCFEC